MGFGHVSCEIDLDYHNDNVKRFKGQTMTNFPHHITFLSDDTELEFVKEVIDKKLKERMAEYIFTKATTINGKTITLALAQIEKLESENLLTYQ